jgi:hypothetical protein
MALHSLKNSGFEATSNSISLPLFWISFLIISLHLFPVQTGTVDLFIKSLYSQIFSPKVLATSSTYFKSALLLFSLSGGVPTAEKIAFQNFIHSLIFVENTSLPCL